MKHQLGEGVDALDCIHQLKAFLTELQEILTFLHEGISEAINAQFKEVRMVGAGVSFTSFFEKRGSFVND